MIFDKRLCNFFSLCRAHHVFFFFRVTNATASSATQRKKANNNNNSKLKSKKKNTLVHRTFALNESYTPVALRIPTGRLASEIKEEMKRKKKTSAFTQNIYI